MKIATTTLAALTISALSLPVQAQSACPVGADMSKGVRFQISSGETETFQRLGNGLIQGFFEIDNGNAIRTLLGKGVYLLEIIDFEDGSAIMGSRTTYSFPSPPEDLPDPVAGGGWSVTVAKLDRGEFGSEAQVYSFGSTTRQTYGTCGYDMIPIEIRYPDENDPKRRDILHYLPEFQLSYLAEYHDEEASDIYSYFNIEAVE